jgi:hypothetical protein
MAYLTLKLSKHPTASIRLSDGREFKMEANSDPDEFVKQLKAVLKNMEEGNKHA